MTAYGADVLIVRTGPALQCPLTAGDPRSDAAVFGPGILGLEHNDARKLGQGGFCSLPDPDRDIFGRGVFEPLDIVQITMVEPFEQRFEGGLDREEIGDKPGGGIDRALKPQFHAIGMTVQPAAISKSLVAAAA